MGNQIDVPQINVPYGENLLVCASYSAWLRCRIALEFRAFFFQSLDEITVKGKFITAKKTNIALVITAL